jgi:hypothetical protein
MNPKSSRKIGDGSSNQERLEAQGYGPTLERIPGLVASARRAFNTNDVACYFWETLSGPIRGLARPRLEVAKVVQDVFPEYKVLLTVLEEPRQDPRYVAFLICGLERWTAATYDLEGHGVLVLS